MHSIEEVRAYAVGLRSILRALKANSGDMEKGVIRFEANVSVKPVGREELGTRVEIKNLNSFRALERSVAYQIEQQKAALERGETITQETLGWDVGSETTFSQRSKEEAHDYRYFPEPDLPPLVVDDAWVESVRAGLPELPRQKVHRLASQYQLAVTDAWRLVEDLAVADYFEACAQAAADIPGRAAAGWITGELFSWLNQSGENIDQLKVPPAALAELLQSSARGEINLPTAKAVFAEMLKTGKGSSEVIRAGGLLQISDREAITGMVARVLQEHPQELTGFLAGKETLHNWFFGQVMRLAAGKANPQVVRDELARQLEACKKDHSS
jgi:aspartyl-tRNA(Asn)/glutamyl-tRNA(Gln) amidotransferase subunit B